MRERERERERKTEERERKRMEEESEKERERSNHYVLEVEVIRRERVNPLSLCLSTGQRVRVLLQDFYSEGEVNRRRFWW